MGAEGGSGGGTVVATGTPEDVVLVKTSHTGQFLAELVDTVSVKPTKKVTVPSLPARLVPAKKTTF